MRARWSSLPSDGVSLRPIKGCGKPDGLALRTSRVNLSIIARGNGSRNLARMLQLDETDALVMGETLPFAGKKSRLRRFLQSRRQTRLSIAKLTKVPQTV